MRRLGVFFVDEIRRKDAAQARGVEASRMIRSVSVRAVTKRKKTSGRPLAMLASVVVLGFVGVVLWRMWAAVPTEALGSGAVSGEELVSNDSPASQRSPSLQPGDPPEEKSATAVLAGATSQHKDESETALQPRSSHEPPAVAEEPAQDVSLTETVSTTETVAEPVDDAQSRTLAGGTSDNTAITAADQLIADGHWLEARKRLMLLMNQDLTGVERNEVRALLQRVADETIFSKRVLDDDPLVTKYTIEAGDRLAKIAPKYDVPYEVIMQINGIKNAGRIRVGQRIKIPRGPFHVQIDASEFRLDLYLQDVYLRSYRVALGRDKGTPMGRWKVTERLEKPRYYPPESAAERKVIAGGDPENPLGVCWIGLEGIAGDAVGKEGFGIHGTNEPESIGHPVSLGCVRMRNEDAKFVYNLLRPGKSFVTTAP
jgi:lipoprotein-anchoring transpeptidase ErfK/SrfK